MVWGRMDWVKAKVLAPVQTKMKSGAGEMAVAESPSKIWTLFSFSSSRTLLFLNTGDPFRDCCLIHSNILMLSKSRGMGVVYDFIIANSTLKKGGRYMRAGREYLLEIGFLKIEGSFSLFGSKWF